MPSYGCTLVRRGVVRRDGVLSLRGPPPPVGFARPPGAAARRTRRGEMEGATPLFRPLVRHRGRVAGAPLCAHQLPSPFGGRSLHSDPCGKAVEPMRKPFPGRDGSGYLAGSDRLSRSGLPCPNPHLVLRRAPPTSYCRLPSQMPPHVIPLLACLGTALPMLDSSRCRDRPLKLVLNRQCGQTKRSATSGIDVCDFARSFCLLRRR